MSLTTVPRLRVPLALRGYHTFFVVSASSNEYRFSLLEWIMSLTRLGPPGRGVDLVPPGPGMGLSTYLERRQPWQMLGSQTDVSGWKGG